MRKKLLNNLLCYTSKYYQIKVLHQISGTFRKNIFVFRGFKSECEKFLGIKFDYKLTFVEHICRKSKLKLNTQQ